MRLRRPRCRCPAGADAEAAADEDAAREAGARTRDQHFFLCSAPGLWERARNNSSALSQPLAQAKTPFLSSLLPRSPSPPFSRSCFTAAQGSQTSAPALRALSGCSFLHEDPDKCPLAGADWLFAEAGTRKGNGSLRRRGVTSQLLRLPPSHAPAAPEDSGPGAEVQEGSCSSPGCAPSRK